jgi:hypothetical protein
MTIIVCIFGGVIGLIAALGARRWGLPFALRSQEAHIRDGKIESFGIPAPAFLRNPQLARQLTIFVYRYCFPLIFVVVFAAAAYQIYKGGSR